MEFIDYSKEEHIFRKKPVTIAAIQWTGNNFEEIKAFFGKDAKKCTHLDEVSLNGDTNKSVKGNLTIETLEGNHTALPGDFIIRGIKGEYYPCKPDIFHDTYELVS